MKGGIIQIVKSKRILLTTLAAVVAATTIHAQTASAATNAGSSPAPEYPSNFVQTLDMSEDGLTDYAIDGNTYAFAVKTTVYVLSTDESGDRALESKDIGTQITAVDYAQGKLYYQITSGSAYAYPDTSTPVEHEFTQATLRVEINDSLYILNGGGELKHFDAKNDETSLGNGYSLLKVYGGTAYAVKDDCPYELKGAQATPLDLEYTDFSAADNISTGKIATDLKTGSYVVETATLKDGSYYTRIDENDIGVTFKQINTLKAVGAISCLVLAADGNLSVIVADGKCWITATENLKPIAYTPPANDWIEGPNGQRKAYIRERAGIYSVPFMCMGTLITTVKAEKAIAVTVLEKFALDFIDNQAVFYRVSFTSDNGATVSGFVSAGFLDEYDYSADDLTPDTSGTEGFSYDTNVMTVILVLVVVGLVIIAIVYLTVVGTKPDKSEKKTRRKQEDDGE